MNFPARVKSLDYKFSESWLRCAYFLLGFRELRVRTVPKSRSLLWDLLEFVVWFGSSRQLRLASRDQFWETRRSSPSHPQSSFFNWVRNLSFAFRFIRNIRSSFFFSNPNQTAARTSSANSLFSSQIQQSSKKVICQNIGILTLSSYSDQLVVHFNFAKTGWARRRANTRQKIKYGIFWREASLRAFSFFLLSQF